MGIDEIKRALVEVKKLCENRKCCNCPLHKTEAVVYCPLNPYEERFGDPAVWDINDWKEGAK